MNTEDSQLSFSLPRVLILVTMIACIGLLDRLSGKDLNFFVFYFFPIAFSAWHFKYLAGALTVLVCTISWYSAALYTSTSSPAWYFLIWNTLIRLIAFSVVAFLTHRVRLALIKEQLIIKELNQSLAQIKVLESFLSICSVCKKIRNEDSGWEQLETYISKHSNTNFSHGYCPDCAGKLLRDAGIKP